MYALSYSDLWKQAIAKFKTIDLIVNNAGIMNDSLAMKTIEINLVSIDCAPLT